MRFPKGWLETKPCITARINKGKKLHARIDMSEEVAGKGLCPECHEKMQRVYISGNVPVLCCMTDRIVLPLKHEDYEKEGNN